MNPLIQFGMVKTHDDMKKMLFQICWTKEMTIDDFINRNEWVILDLISWKLDGRDLDAMYIWKCDTELSYVVDFMRNMYNYYIYGDDTYLLCKH